MTTHHNCAVTYSITELHEEISDFYIKTRDVSDNERDEVSLSYNDLDLLQLIAKANRSSAGAISTFFGTTRDNFEGKEVTHLEYESYPTMALDRMIDLCTNARQQWKLLDIVIQHKLGACPIKHVSIAIVISSEHRKDSLEAVSFVIDELKKTVPIWKREFYKNGEAEWKANQTDQTEVNGI